MKVKCIDNCYGTYALTINKEYEVKSRRGSDREWFCVISDSGQDCCYHVSFFEIVKEDN